jgi:hypothetical protein
MTLLKSFLMTLIYALVFFACRGRVEIPDDVQQEMSKISKSIDYTYDVKPILSDRCFACHGPDAAKQKAGLRLDIAEVAYKKLSESGAIAIVPGKLAGSEMVHRILSTDPEVIMPTKESHLSLTAREKAILIKWIEQGAEYKPHWAFTKVKRPEVPKVKGGQWVKNDIDRFILAKLEENGFKPSPQATKTTLLRRVYMDLIGMPPTPQQVEAFVNDHSANAYEKVVDRLLASEHYGENMAVPWLDAARYADTHGYQDDMMRTAWPFRDWVINAFNKNISYDKFVTWQLAGDLLPNPEPQQMVATAFNRMHPQSMEGGIIEEEYRTEYVADRVGTFGTTFLGMTIECARCHDHKYDPISQKDYYSLYSFFDNVNENGQIPYNGESSPSVTLPTPEAEKTLKFIEASLETEKDKRTLLANSSAAGFAQWLRNAEANPAKNVLTAANGLYGHFTFDEPLGKEFENLANPKHKAHAEGDDSLSNVASRRGKIGNARRIFGENAVDFGPEFAFFERNQPFTISIWLNLLDASINGSIIHKSNHITSGFRGWNIFRDADGSMRVTLSHVWPDNSIEVKTVNKFPLKQWTQIAFTYDGLSKAEGLKVYVNGEMAPVKVFNDNLTQSLLFGKNKTNITVLNMQIGRMRDRFTKNFDVDELKIYTRALSSLEMRGLFSQRDEVMLGLKTPVNKRSKRLSDELLAYYMANIDKAYQNSIAASLSYVGQQTELLNTQIDVMVMKERLVPRKSYILNRGAYDARGKEVTADTPDQIFKIPNDYPKNRLGLARWLLHKDHPLFSRVAVNRFWQQYFGHGLVLSTSDFGNQGNLPTHPALLDWLASEFRESAVSGKWNVKALQKLIVMSATYMQSSIAGPMQLESDPENLFYTRGPSYRMSAEQIRDNALVSSGLINERIGGPSVYPYQPKGLWEAISNYGKYRQQKGDTLYRRSMYTIWKRTVPPPMMLNFDASERQNCVVKRQKTSTPLQALVVMNDPQFVEASRVLAQNMLRQPGDLDKKLTYGFMALTGRKPSPKEITILKELYQEELMDFRKNPGRVKAVLSTGEYPVNKLVNPMELAAGTIVTSTIMNFDEFMIKR